ncbi:MAG: 2-amino-4-hydroxy-6-hydroxymethyldihydropteridine diphosphokinase [Verrucomicrobiales bacterium]
MKFGFALGSNVGDRRACLIEARSRLEQLAPDSSELLCASLYESAPLDCPPGSAPFLNTCLELELELDPEALHTLTRELERFLGRPEVRAQNAPRTIDIDILYAGDLTLRGPELILPHPRLHQRRFVLEPLCEIRPALVLPGLERSVSALLNELETREAAPILVARDW